MKKLLSIILACALLAVPFAITTMAAADSCCAYDNDAIVCDAECCDECEVDVLPTPPTPTRCNCENDSPRCQDCFSSWQRFVNTIMPYLTDLRNIATRVTPIIAMVVAIINLVRMFT
ncbi:MAG: hypothetical protein FWB76_00565 [Oscillospiraceae bacterium]|nr:hypothetical protein [Oscillospiraceae bacterium]